MGKLISDFDILGELGFQIQDLGSILGFWSFKVLGICGFTGSMVPIDRDLGIGGMENMGLAVWILYMGFSWLDLGREICWIGNTSGNRVLVSG